MNQDRYQAALDICHKHADRLKWAMDNLRPRFPLAPTDLAALSDADQAVTDQFILRFSKLQDAMGNQLFASVLDMLQEPGDLDAFIDKLNRLEKLGAIDAASSWQQSREMRNQFAHDYPDDPEIQASLLNKGFALAEALLDSLADVEVFADRYLTDG